MPRKTNTKRPNKPTPVGVTVVFTQAQAVVAARALNAGRVHWAAQHDKEAKLCHGALDRLLASMDRRGMISPDGSIKEGFI